MLLHHRKLLTSVGGVFNVEAVTFDGTTDYLTRGSDLTGSADGKEVTVSFWLKMNANDGTNKIIFGADNNTTRIRKNASNNISFEIEKVGGGNAAQALSTTSYTVSSGWIHVLFSADVANSNIYLYINDVDDGASLSTDNTNIDFTRSDYFLGIDSGLTNFLNADIAEFYFAQEYIDLSVAANRRKFITADGKPVNLGADGSLPTGTAPIIYLSNRPGDSASDFITNRGTGGNFTENGALAVASTSPSD